MTNSGSRFKFAVIKFRLKLRPAVLLNEVKYPDQPTRHGGKHVFIGDLPGKDVFSRDPGRMVP